MDLDTKLVVLNRIYRIYDDYCSKRDVACRRYCAHCCTRNVTLTTLEGCLIKNHLEKTGNTVLLEKLKDTRTRDRFQPKLTTNTMAALCMEGKDLPEEESDVSVGECPFLTDDNCPIYPVRPFGCRLMSSTIRCDKGGHAVMDPFLLTVNDIFMQYIEHIDQDGMTGNFIDVLLHLSSPSDGHPDETATGELIPNRSIPVLMIPPEHRLKIMPLLNAVRAIDVS